MTCKHDLESKFSQKHTMISCSYFNQLKVMCTTGIELRCFEKCWQIRDWQNLASSYLLSDTVPAPQVSVSPYPWEMGQQKHTCMNRWVVPESGAPPDSIIRTRPPRALRVFLNTNLHKSIQTLLKWSKLQILIIS